MARKKAAPRRASDPGDVTTGRADLPASLRQFVERQTTIPVADVWDGDPEEERSPYGSHWYRAVVCILLSGRVQARADGTPNMTDVNRVGKEANFNQYLTERVGKLLLAMGAIDVDRQERYGAGPELSVFWGHDVERLPTITRQAVLRLFRQQATTNYSWNPKPVED